LILCSGAFDGLHAGHVRYLLAAASFKNPDEALHVSVAPDAYIRREKNREPYWTQEERCLAVSGIAGVDEAWPDQNMTPADYIRKIQPRAFVKGSDWFGKLPQDVIDACALAGTLIVYVDTPGRHTSEARG